MRIGILAITSKISGGVYPYTQSLVESLTQFTSYDYLIIKSNEFTMPELANTNYRLVEIKTNPSTLLIKIKKVVYVSFPIMRNFFNVSSNYKDIKKYKLDIIINPLISLIPLYIDSKYIVTIHDLQHRHYPKFFTLKEGLSRNYIYKNAAKNALLVICESNFVKRDVVRFLNIPEEKIRVISSPPPEDRIANNINLEKLEEIKNKYNLMNKFLFYPAHFWYHKNHLNLIRAMHHIKETLKEKISVILVGSKKNDFENTMNEINRLKLDKQIRYLGYVPEEDMPYLYKLSTALVMPTLFESLSMPIWEAFHLGCPVVSSNVRALPEQVGNAGLLFDPNDIKNMAEKIYRIWIDENLRKELIQKGYERVKDMTLENYARQWERVIEEALDMRKT